MALEANFDEVLAFEDLTTGEKKVGVIPIQSLKEAKQTEAFRTHQLKVVTAIISPKPNSCEPANPHITAIINNLSNGDLVGLSPLERTMVMQARSAELLCERDEIVTNLQRAVTDPDYRNSAEIEFLMNSIQQIEGLGNCSLEQAVILTGRRLNIIAVGGVGTYNDDLSTYGAILDEIEAATPPPEVRRAIPNLDRPSGILVDITKAKTLVPARPERVVLNETSSAVNIGVTAVSKQEGARKYSKERKKREDGFTARQGEVVLAIIQPKPDTKEPQNPTRNDVATTLLKTKARRSNLTGKLALVSQATSLTMTLDSGLKKIRAALADPRRFNEPGIQDLLGKAHQLPGLEDCNLEDILQLAGRSLLAVARAGKRTFGMDLLVYAEVLDKISARSNPQAKTQTDGGAPLKSAEAMPATGSLGSLDAGGLVTAAEVGSAKEDEQIVVASKPVKSKTTKNVTPIRPKKDSAAKRSAAPRTSGPRTAKPKDDEAWNRDPTFPADKFAPARNNLPFGYQRPTNPEVISFSPQDIRVMLARFAPEIPLRDNPYSEVLAKNGGYSQIENQLLRLRVSPLIDADSNFLIKWLNSRSELANLNGEQLVQVFRGEPVGENLKLSPEDPTA